MARHVGSGRDLTLLVGTVVLAALPEFVVGIALILLFGTTLGILPVDSSGLAFGSLEDRVLAYVLPALTLVLVMVPYLARMARACMREALLSPYAEAATLRGLSPRTVTWTHAFPNAAVPLVNAVAINIVYLLGGVIVVENVFGFPGIGQQLVRAIENGDTISVQAIALVMGAMFIAISLAADLLVTALNPRLRRPAS
jgi:peptide/nickel transport system permease protein